MTLASWRTCPVLEVRRSLVLFFVEKSIDSGNDAKECLHRSESAIRLAVQLGRVPIRHFVFPSITVGELRTLLFAVLRSDQKLSGNLVRQPILSWPFVEQPDHGVGCGGHMVCVRGVQLKGGNTASGSTSTHRIVANRLVLLPSEISKNTHLPCRIRANRICHYSSRSGRTVERIICHAPTGSLAVAWPGTVE